MLISYKWLQSYFEEKLPEPEKLAELLTFSFAEVEGIEKKGGDTILDIKVLPDRACYGLSHRGVAYEVSAITGFKRKIFSWPQPEVKKVRMLSVRVESELCPRYMARVIENVTPKEMSWVKEHLEAIDKRSINPLVDGANIVMFDIGQPLHAFDADKVEGGLVVRMARKGEKITTLDNREVVLDESVLIIADEKSPLAIAGIKGGKKAEVTSETRSIILESANFNGSHIRKTSERLGIKTDASKRYENKLSAEWTAVGMNDFTAYLYEMDRNIAVGEITDICPTLHKQHPYKLEYVRILLAPEYISQKLGLKITDSEIEKVLNRLEIEIDKKEKEWILTPPHFRGDLTISEDIAEEVGRLVGYEKVPALIPPYERGCRVREARAVSSYEKAQEDCEISKTFYYEYKIREILVNAGFSEVMTSSFSETGTVEILKPLADDKKFARPDLRCNFKSALKMNSLNAPLFGATETMIFEIGKIFPKDGEKTALAIGVAGPKEKVAGVLELAIKSISEALAVLTGETNGGVFECALDTVFEKLPEPKKWDISIPPAQTKKFQPFSLYPFIVRDIALFVPPDTKPEAAVAVINEHAGNLVIRGPELFDEFSKDGKKSFAFRLVFQSSDRTLSDEEVNKIMEKVYSALKANGWEIR